MKLPARFLFPVVMAFFMSLVMSFVLTLINVGPVPNFFLIWPRSWAIGFCVAVPTAILVTPLVHKIVKRLSSDEK